MTSPIEITGVVRNASPLPHDAEIEWWTMSEYLVSFPPVGYITIYLSYRCWNKTV